MPRNHSRHSPVTSARRRARSRGLSRREFLKTTVAAGATLVSLGGSVPACFGRAALAEAAKRDRAGTILVIVQLSGGNDGLNTIVPFDDDIYARNRPTLRLTSRHVLKLNERLGWHPSLKGAEPGNDWIAVTGQVASGCNLVVFTTGRGSAFGFRPAPVLKVCTNSTTYHRMEEDMDFNAGRIVEGEPAKEVAKELLDLVVAIASGQASKSEAQGIGEAEFCPWSLGGIL